MAQKGELDENIFGSSRQRGGRFPILRYDRKRLNKIGQRLTDRSVENSIPPVNNALDNAASKRITAPRFSPPLHPADPAKREIRTIIWPVSRRLPIYAADKSNCVWESM